MSKPDDTQDPSEATIDAETAEAQAAHQADRAPTPDEEAAAPTQADPEVARHFEEMEEIGTHIRGEGKI